MVWHGNHRRCAGHHNRGFLCDCAAGRPQLDCDKEQRRRHGPAIVGAVLLLFSTTVVAFEVAAWRSTETALTNLRVIRTTEGVRRGDTGDTNLGIPISQIEDIQVDQDIVGQLLGYGTIRIRVKEAPEATAGQRSREVLPAGQERIAGSASSWRDSSNCPNRARMGRTNRRKSNYLGLEMGAR